jgi:putative aldouronate transport system substrate-binding protein
MSRKWLNSLTVVVLMLSTLLFAACAGNGNNNSSTEGAGGNNGPNKTSDNQVSEVEDTDPLGPYKETITVTQTLGFSPPQDAKTPKGLTPEENGYLKKLNEMLNIEVDYLWTVPSEQAEQKFALAVSSGELPDVMQLGLRDFEDFRQQDMLADLTDAYEKYASPILRKYLESDGGRTLKMFTYDGKLLGLPSFEDPFMSTQLLWIRTDWLTSLGLEAPATLEELEKVALAFSNDDPDGNGKDDTYGISMNKDLITWGFDARGMFNTMGAYPKAWIKGSDGQLIPGEIQPETKAALGKLSEWYEKGILDKEFGFKDLDKAVEDVVAGKVGIAFGEWWYPEWPLNLNKEKDPNAAWKAYPLPSYNGEPGLSLVPGLRIAAGIAVAHKDFEHPEAVVKMANFYHEMQLPKYKDINKPENGFVYNWYSPRIYNPNNIDDLFTSVNEALSSGQSNIEFENPEAPTLYERVQRHLAGEGDATDWGFYTSRVAEDGGWGTTRKIKESKNFVFNEFTGTPTPTQAERGSSLDKMTDELFIKMIMGGAPLSEFDSYTESWKKLGGNDITKEVNEWYKEMQ